MLFLTATLAGVVYLSIVWAFARSFLITWIVLLAINFLNFAFGLDSILIGSFHFYALDLFYLCIFPAGLVRFRWHGPSATHVKLVAFGYLLLFGLSLMRGFALFAVTDVGNEARGLMNVVMALVYFLTVPREGKVLKQVVSAYLVYAAALCAIAVAHYAGLPVGGSLGIAKGLVVDDDIDRAIPAAAASSIELSLLLASSWAVYRRHSSWIPVLCAAFVPLVIVLQHRTVWAMLGGTLLASAYLDRRIFRYLLRVSAISAGIGLIILALNRDLRVSLAGQLKESATNSDTLEWRFESWKRSLAQDQSMESMLIGLPVGTGYLRIDTAEGTYTAFPPHDEFINQYLRVGIIGTVLLLVLALRPVYGYFKNPEAGMVLFPTPASWILVVIGAFLFCIPYSATFDGFAFIAMANGVIDLEPPLTPRVAAQRAQALQLE